jgi:hypothetical protein
MSQFAQVWDSTETGATESVIPPVGMYEARVADAKLGTKDADHYLVVEYVTTKGEEYRWSDFKWLTKNGAPHEGRIKSAKILLSSLGYPTVTSGTLKETVEKLPDREYAVEIVSSSAINAVTGEPYRNTVVSSALSPAVSDVPSQVTVQAPAAAAAPAADDDLPF